MNENVKAENVTSNVEDNVMNEEEFIDKKDLRDKAINRVEVLDKVKELFLIPSMELVTTSQVADYYEVPVKTIQMCYLRNKAEINEDGMFVKTAKDFNALTGRSLHDVDFIDLACKSEGRNNEDFNALTNQNVHHEHFDALVGESKSEYSKDFNALTGRSGHDVQFIDLACESRSENTVEALKYQGGASYKFSNGTLIKVPNRGVRCFSKRAVLRIGMLLRDSEVAKEVRTQLLNVFEQSTTEQKTADIENEQNLYLTFAKAAIEGSKDDLLYAAQEVFQFKNRHIKMLQEKNDELKQDNQMLAVQILKWSERSEVNKAVRIIASLRKVPFAYIWRDLYQELLYKHHIGLTMRGKKPYLQHVKEEEWPMVQQSLAAICEDNGISISKVLWKMKHDDPKKYIDKDTETDNDENKESEEE